MRDLSMAISLYNMHEGTKLLSSALHLRVKQHKYLSYRGSHFFHAVKPINKEVKTKSFFSDNFNYVSLITCGCKRPCSWTTYLLFKKLILLQGHRKRIAQLGSPRASPNFLDHYDFELNKPGFRWSYFLEGCPDKIHSGAPVLYCNCKLLNKVCELS